MSGGVEQVRHAVVGSSGVALLLRQWTPEPCRGVVVLAHGMSEHSGRYEHVAEYLAARGLAVYAHDHYGHGRSGGVTGSVADFGHFLEDLALVVERARAEHPGLPLVLVGHSMGGLIALAYVLDQALAQPDLLVLSGPAIVPLVTPGDRTIDPSRLSRDPEVWEPYMSDPYVLRERVTEELFARLADGIGRIVGRAGEIRVPVLLIHGLDDPVCSAEGARMYLESGELEDFEMRLYEGGRHEMFNEVNRDEVLADLADWIAARL